MDSTSRNLRRHMRTLCLEIGERHLGSKGEADAVDYISKVLGGYDCEVARQTFPGPGWRYGAYRLAVSGGRAFPCFPCFYSPACAQTGRLLPLSLRAASTVEAAQVRGRICFVHGEFRGVGDTNKLAERLEGLGAAAMIIVSPYGGAVSTKIVRNPALRRLGVMTVSQGAALEIARRLDRDFTLKIAADRFEVTSCNVIGRQQGPGRGRVVLGAHYDTAPGIQGAWDNASGTAVLLELARLLRGRMGRMSLEFVAFGGEEYGGVIGCGLGSYHYVQAHKKDLSRVAWMGCFDGVGVLLGEPYVSVGRSEKVRAAAASVCAPRGVEVCPFHRGSDNGVFHDHGVPTVWFSDHIPDSGVGHIALHSPQDTLKIMDWPRLTSICELAARLAERLGCTVLSCRRARSKTERRR